MRFFISILIINFFIYWLFLIGANKNKSEEEQYTEDNMQMEYLKKYSTHKIS